MQENWIDTIMLFEWDEAKSLKCLATRGFDFDFAKRVFDDELRITIEDHRFDYGEERYIAYGNIDFRLFCIVYTFRYNRIRIISARKANSREIKIYGHNLS